MNRIIVIGGNGSGKSTFSKQLAAVTHLPLVHLDRLLWHGHWQTRTREEFDALLDAELQKDRWIIDGNYNRTIPNVCPIATRYFTSIFLPCAAFGASRNES